ILQLSAWYPMSNMDIRAIPGRRGHRLVPGNGRNRPDRGFGYLSTARGKTAGAPLSCHAGKETQRSKLAISTSGGIAMLVVTRSTGDEIVIDDNIRITVTMVRGDRVRLGITAPESLCVVRAELLKRQVKSGTSLLPPSKHQQ